jgi:hypothetical protein
VTFSVWPRIAYRCYRDTDIFVAHSHLFPVEIIVWQSANREPGSDFASKARQGNFLLLSSCLLKLASLLLGRSDVNNV